MKNLMGFFEDFKNIIINTKLELDLLRSKNKENCHNTVLADANANIDVKITI